MESTAKSYISNSYQGILKSYRHRIFYTLDKTIPVCIYEDLSIRISDSL